MRCLSLFVCLASLIYATASCQSMSAHEYSFTHGQRKFLEENIKTVCSDSTQAIPSWTALLPYLKNKNIILVGEFNHGSKEIFSLRNDLIKSIHKNVGLKAILFESGIGELIAADLFRNGMTDAEMTNGLFGNWRTNEFAQLMRFAKENDIQIAGFDVQRTGGSFSKILMTVGSGIGIDSAHAYGIESRYGVVSREINARNAVFDSLKAKTNELILDYRKVENILDNSPGKEKSRALIMSVHTVRNRIAWFTYMLQFLEDKDWHRRWAARDIMMASNVEFLIDNFYKGQRVVVVGHNYHIARHNDVETVMGAVLQKTRRDEMYSMGIFAAQGTYSDNSGKAVALLPPVETELDIKHVILSMNSSVGFMNVASKQPNGDWLKEEITVNDTFINLNNVNRMNLSKAFDGLLLLKSVSPAAGIGK